MSIDEFLGKLQGVTSDGKGGWMACCPAHDDHNPSMHVNVGKDGRILVKCYAGCTTADIVAALGLKMRDLMAERSTPGRAGESGRGKGKGRGEASKAASGQESADSASSAATVAGPTFAARKKRPSRHVCYYNYKREDGAIVYRVDRRVYTDAKGGKTFIQMSPDGKGGWTFGVASQGVEYIPYQLPRIRKAAADGKSVVIC